MLHYDGDAGNQRQGEKDKLGDGDAIWICEFPHGRRLSGNYRICVTVSGLILSMLCPFSQSMG